jgi:hypothetical protein
MDNYHYVLFLIFSIIGVMIVIDANVADYIVLLTRMIKLNTERVFWMIRLHPKNPISNFMMNRKYYKIAKELEEEFRKKNEIE